jgi:hypothetical protein
MDARILPKDARKDAQDDCHRLRVVVAAALAMNLHVMVHHTLPDGQLSTIWKRPAVADLSAAEPLAKQAVHEARRAGGSNLRIEVFDDLLCRSAYRARVK